MNRQIETLETEIKRFVDSLPYWAKHISDKILSGNEVTDSDIEISYSYLLEDLQLKETTERAELTISYNPSASDDYKEDIVLKSIKNVEGVNALAENQTIEITPNLTIIFGANGAGKSGYVRFLKEAFYSKHQEIILSNVNAELESKPISAEFNFLSESLDIQLKYPDNIDNGIFQQFSVFDGNIAKKHLSERNTFNFRPAGLNLFNEFNNALEKIYSRLSLDIQTRSIANPFADDDIFQGESEIKTILVSLAHFSNLEELEKHLPYTEEDSVKKLELEQRYDKIKIAHAQKDRELKHLQTIKDLLIHKKQSLKDINTLFSEKQLNVVSVQILQCNSKEELARREGINIFKTDKILNVGSLQWKSFIEAANRFALEQKHEAQEYPDIGDNCLLCHQPILDNSTKDLIQNYWVYIKSVAEVEARSAYKQLTKTKQCYFNLDFNQFSEFDVLSEWLNERYNMELSQLRGSLQQQEALATKIETYINNKQEFNESEIQTELSIFDEIIAQIDIEIQQYINDEQVKMLGELSKQKTYLFHKEKLQGRYSDIQKLHANMIWRYKASRFNKQALKTKSTNEEKRLSQQYFNLEYVDAFNMECTELNANFGIDIDARSSNAISNRKLRIKQHDPALILSEGEQKVIALADFIAEANITSANKGIIFDDPVNSLDNERKSAIAKRLVDISQGKQVVIFTHDLAFVYSLKNYASEMNINHTCHWMENRDGKSGLVWLHESPANEKTYRNAECVKGHLKDAKTDHCSPEQREYYLKIGFTALRTCYEVLVINELFCNVVQRFNERISIDALSSVKFDEEVKSEILDGFALCCKHMEGHSHSNTYGYERPTIENLQLAITHYEVIRKKVKDLKKS